jgi:hypothetical protein
LQTRRGVGEGQGGKHRHKRFEKVSLKKLKKVGKKPTPVSPVYRYYR